MQASSPSAVESAISQLSAQILELAHRVEYLASRDSFHAGRATILGDAVNSLRFDITSLHAALSSLAPGPLPALRSPSSFTSTDDASPSSGGTAQ